MKIAILDDYQEVAMKLTDWSSIPGHPEIKVFSDHISDFGKLVDRLSPTMSFGLCVRELL